MAENTGFTALLALQMLAFAPALAENVAEPANDADALPAATDGKAGGKDLPAALPPFAGQDKGGLENGAEAEQAEDTVLLALAAVTAPAPEPEAGAPAETAARGLQPLPRQIVPLRQEAVQQAPPAGVALDANAVRFVENSSETLPSDSAAEPKAPGTAKAPAALRGGEAPAAVSVSAAPAVQAPASASQPQAAASLAPAAAPAPRDIATLIDRLVEARDMAASQTGGGTVGATLAHAQFGRVAMQFRPGDGGLTVSMTSSDPGFAPAAQSAAQAVAAAASSQGASADDNRGSQPRFDQQPGAGGNPAASHSDARQSGSQARQDAPLQTESGRLGAFVRTAQAPAPDQPHSRGGGIYA